MSINNPDYEENDDPVSPDEGDEALREFPNLARARALYSQLLTTDAPLRALGYTEGQIVHARPALQLIAERGEIVIPFFEKNFCLNFKGQQRSPNHNERPTTNREEIIIANIYDDLSARIKECDDKSGFILSANRWKRANHKKILSEIEPSSKEEIQEVQNAIHGLTIQSTLLSTNIFEDDEAKVAHIELLNSTGSLNDIHYLAKHFGKENSSPLYRRLGIQPKNILSKVARAIGLTITYETAWVDERTKLELVIKLTNKDSKFVGSTYVWYRKLPPISDSLGTLIPFGQKPTSASTGGKIEEILRESKEAYSGELAWGLQR